MSFGNRLKQLREERELKQEELGKILNVSRQSISNYENGLRFPNDEKFLIKLANFFDVSLDYLLGLSNVRIKINDKKFNTYLNFGRIKEMSEKYEYEKNKALEKLFQEVDTLPVKTIEKITATIKLFKENF